MINPTEYQDNLLELLVEECAEVIMSVTKIRRFGLDSTWNGSNNHSQLTTEIGDVIGIVALLVESGLINQDYLGPIAETKKEKAKRWIEYSAALREVK